ncbi:hypothetical protein [Saccharicrinis aurantiacus]|uniref:hypothetical protein n=1 Tax=Saccharicrinis aurantiacus TaxID=1849719 RepID=UPI00094FC4A9|nr:hypothetical protein [Saccharicrinis aurantiacus]
MKYKISKFIIPFIIGTSLHSLFYAFVYYYCIVVLKQIPSYTIVLSWAPFITAGLFMWLGFDRKLKLIDLDRSGRRPLLGIEMVLLAGIALFLQFHIEEKYSELTTLDNINDIHISDDTRYYSLNNTIQLKEKTKVEISEHSLGRYGSEISVQVSFTCPIVDKVNQEYNGISISKRFTQTFSNRVFDDKIKERKLINNYIDSIKTYYNDFEFNTQFLEDLSYSDRGKINKSLISNKKKVYVLEEIDGNYSRRMGHSLWWIKISFIVANVIWILSIMMIKITHPNKLE